MVHPRALSRILKSDDDSEALVSIVCVIINCANKRSTSLFFVSEQLRIAACTSGFDDAAVGSFVSLVGGLDTTPTGLREGDELGILDGLILGACVGLTVGDVGWIEGGTVGTTDGAVDGFEEGTADGTTLGNIVGVPMGTDDGRELGVLVGTTEGDAVGAMGLRDGEEVGTSDE